ncbi:hypothetical protein LZN10_13285, partial [Pseudomonas aeruginosa]|nr:hypothetical protein [Pseudomonas aeruginosa]
NAPAASSGGIVPRAVYLARSDGSTLPTEQCYVDGVHTLGPFNVHYESARDALNPARQVPQGTEDPYAHQRTTGHGSTASEAAMRYDQNAGIRQRARRNIDAWWPLLREGAEAIVQTASGCGAFVKDYAYLLRDDPRYADKAREVAAAARDLVEVLRDEPLESLGLRCDQRLAFHCPCTLQHAQRLGGAVESVLRRLGFHLTEVADGHLCCGSAGTYSLTQPALSRRLRDNRLDALESGAPDVIATANVGCQAHLDGAGRTPVRHWIELLDQALPGGE